MTYLVEHLPLPLHLILATRTDPPFPLARLRAQGQLCEVRSADLCFGTAEASAFLQTVMGLDLSPEAIATLEHRTEGWIAGLQLAALSLQGRTDVSAFLAAFTGSSSLCAGLSERRGSCAAARSQYSGFSCTPRSWSASVGRSAMQ